MIYDTLLQHAPLVLVWLQLPPFNCKGLLKGFAPGSGTCTQRTNTFAATNMLPTSISS